jgi:flavodoxin
MKQLQPHLSVLMHASIVLCCTLIGCGGEDQSKSQTVSTPKSSSVESESHAAVPKAGDDGRFAGEGFSVNTPSGFKWKFTQSVRNGQVDGAVYVCSQPGSTTAMSLTIENRRRSNDGFRNAGVIGHYDGTIDSLVKTGVKVIRVEKPDLAKPIADRVPFFIEGKQSNGGPVYCYGMSVFGDQTYVFQAFSASQAEARQLIAFASTFSED